MGLIETYKEQIRKLCVNHKVKNPYSFESVNTASFTAESDVDLVIGGAKPARWAGCCMDSSH